MNEQVLVDRLKASSSYHNMVDRESCLASKVQNELVSTKNFVPTNDVRRYWYSPFRRKCTGKRTTTDGSDDETTRNILILTKNMAKLLLAFHLLTSYHTFPQANTFLLLSAP